MAVSLDRARRPPADDPAQPRAVRSAPRPDDAARRPIRRIVRIRSAATSSAPTASCPDVAVPSRAGRPNEILAEARQLADQGCQEITLLGQTVNSYQYRDGRTDVRGWPTCWIALHEIDGIRRLKFVTNYPEGHDRRTCSRPSATCPSARPTCTCPAQSGSNAVLQRMKRGYTVEEYREMLARIRETMPGAAVTSDFIVGFCGETDEDFQQTIGDRARVPLQEQLHLQVQPTARHEGRRAATPTTCPTSQTPAEQRTAGHAERDQRGGQPSVHRPHGRSAGRRSQQGHDEARRHAPEVQLMGRTHGDRIVVFQGSQQLVGQILPVRVRDVTAHTLLGERER